LEKGLVTKAALQMAGIVFTASLLALLGNSARKECLPLATPLILDSRCGSEADAAQALSVKDALIAIEMANAVFLDIRPRDEFLKGHIRGAVNLVYSVLEHFPEESVTPLKTKDNVIVYSFDGLDGKAEQAVGELLVAGVKGAVSLSGGFLAWVKAGGPCSGIPPSDESRAE
jgi:rhodanese-related sulfurtransferase